VSVIIPTKNRAALLCEALRSVRAVEGPGLDLEVIVADNGSTDDTEAVARTFQTRFVRTLTQGPAAARNAGLRAATGEYLAFLDDDDIWLPTHLRPHLALLRAQPELGAVMGQIRIVDDRGAGLALPYPGRLPADGDVFQALLSAWTQIGALVARTSVLSSIGYQDETLLAAEEWDWMLRLALRHRVGFVPVPCLLFRSRRPSHQEDALNRERAGINRRVYWRNVWRAGRRRPSLRTAVRTSLRYDGIYAGNLLYSAVAHADAADWSAARAAFVSALRVSPMHAAWALLRRSAIRRALGQTLLAGHQRLSQSQPQ